MAEQKATNIVWHPGAVTRTDRERLNGHRVVRDGVDGPLPGGADPGGLDHGRTAYSRLKVQDCLTSVESGPPVPRRFD